MLLLILHTAVTFALVGLIWTVQVVHYPLMNGVGTAGFRAYHRRHARAVTFVVGPLMIAEILGAVMLTVVPLEGVPAALAWAGLGLVILVWGATAFVSVPLHQRLEAGFDADAHARLVRTNWIRTAAWTARGLVTLAMLVHHGSALEAFAPVSIGA